MPRARCLRRAAIRATYFTGLLGHERATGFVTVHYTTLGRNGTRETATVIAGLGHLTVTAIVLLEGLRTNYVTEH